MFRKVILFGLFEMIQKKKKSSDHVLKSKFGLRVRSSTTAWAVTAYGSRGFLPFLFEGFPLKNCCLIVVDLLLFGWLCCWLNCLLNLFFGTQRGKCHF